MDVEQRAREPNPNVAVIHEAMQHFPEGSWMRGALDHAAAELAVLHERCQRAALTPPEGYVLVPIVPTEEMEFIVGNPHEARFYWEAMVLARPEVKP